MQFDRIVEHGEGRFRRRKILMMPDLPEGSVSGNIINGRGPGVTAMEGAGVLISPLPAMTARLVNHEMAEDMLSVHQNGAGRVNSLKDAITELVEGFDEHGQPVSAGRLKNGEFVEHDQPRGAKFGEFLGTMADTVN